MPHTLGPVLGALRASILPARNPASPLHAPSPAPSIAPPTATHTALAHLRRASPYALAHARLRPAAQGRHVPNGDSSSGWRPPAPHRSFATSAACAAKVVDGHHDHDRAAERPLRGVAGGVIETLRRSRGRGPWWWRVAKGQVEAHRQAAKRSSAAFASASSSSSSFARRSSPSAAQTHDCHHSHAYSESGSGSGSSHRRSSSSHEHPSSCSHGDPGCASPIAGCRARGATSGWGWYLALNERRRRDPQRRAHFRHVCRTMHQWDAAAHAGARATGRGGRKRFGRGGRKEFVRRREAHESHVASVRRLLLAHRAQAGRRSSGEQSQQQQQQHRSGPFNHDAFRSSYWGATFRPSHIDPNRGAKHAHFTHRPGGIKWMRYHAPQDYVRYAHTLHRLKTGFAIIRLRELDNPAFRVRASPARPAPLARASPLEARRPAAPATASLALRAGACRALSSSARRLHPLLPPPVVPPTLAAPCLGLPLLELGLPLLLPLATVLKSSAALNALAFVTRISLTLLPLAARSRWIHSLRTRYTRDPTSLTSSIWGRHALQCHLRELETASSPLTRWTAGFGVPLLVLTPLVLLALVALASLERTPITGRWRVVMLSPAEEADLVHSVLDAAPAVPASARAAEQEGTTRDWVSILRHVLSIPDEGRSELTGRRILLGGEVLDPRDWRVRWAEAVLRALERGAPGAFERGDDYNAAAATPAAGLLLRPPPTSYPLEPRPEALGEGASGAWRDELLLAKTLEKRHAHQHHVAHAAAESANGTGGQLRLEYDLLVVDRDDANAFSFGFGPDEVAGLHGAGVEGTEGAANKPRRGVIVVYTGFLNEILGRNGVAMDELPTPPPTPPKPSRSLFGLSSTSSSHAPTAAPLPDPIAANLVPRALPTDAQTRALAVLLSHELAHLALSHTLESYASTTLLVPHISRLTSDVIRTLAYPITAFFGPFINDAVGKSLSEGARGGFGFFGQAVNSCESRLLESEADVVALRLLASSGIDPHFALSFWEDRLSSPAHHAPSSPSASSTPPPQLSHPHPLRLHSKYAPHAHSPSANGDDVLDGLFRSHPVDEERVERIRVELAGWEEWWAAHAPAQSAAA
ncbi:hypothetical protein Rhopal_003893-T1 [Rhodotorula paludigena]|uniref:Peptidase M48 domain-containing protein n=1 Tax=Rhodotorula paludigena TaxID=86838 RepID=A0AAV5GK73_9BASI|nr:hypothetical protein Rhopal_003893-T1 [Rhodotorula paludigena]